jgi:hypothetical protein
VITAEKFTGKPTTLTLRNLYEEYKSKLPGPPPNKLNIGDRDSKDYNKTLTAQKKIDKNGFPFEI